MHWNHNQGEFYSILIMALCMAESLVVAYDYSPVALSIAADFRLTYSDIGLLQTSLFIPFMVLQIPAGLVSDRYDSKRVIFAALAMITVSSFFFPISWSKAVLFSTRIITGISLGFMFVPVVRFLIVSIGKLGIGMSLGILGGMQAFGSIVASLGPVALSNITGGWRSALMLLAIPLPILLILLSYVKEKQRQNETSEMYNSFRKVLSNKTTWLLGYDNFVRYGIVVMVTTWIPAYLVEQFHYSLLDASITLGLMWLAAAIMSIVGGYLSDMERGKPFVIVIALAGTAIVLASTPELAYNSTRIIVFLVLGGLMYFSFSPMFFMLPSLLGKEIAGFASGVENMMATSGAAFFPFMMGYIRDVTGGYGDGWLLSSLLVAAAALISLEFITQRVGDRKNGKA
jgi:nitrate/nitrite transporter NarK